jgi:DNA-directed RNA polymerase subunit RPC12/RpoP
MIAKPNRTASDTNRDNVPPDIHAYAIEIPDAFLDAFDGETVQEKLRSAESAESTTDLDRRPRCPECGSVRVKIHVGYIGQRAGYKEPFRCTYCNSHIWELVTPAEASRSDEQTGLDEFTDE